MELKPTENFHKKPRNLDGLDTQCKQCHKIYQIRYRQGHLIKDENGWKDSKHIDFKGIRKSEWCQTYRILSVLGYNLEMDIHTQFIERHPVLVLKQRPTRNRQSFKPEDCK